MEQLKIPPIILERYNQLYDLIQNKSFNGRIEAKEVAKYLNKDRQWFQRAICNGAVPFAFGDVIIKRSISYIGILPFWQYETQGLLLKR